MLKGTEVKKFDSIEIGTSDFGRLTRIASASQLQLGKVPGPQVFSFTQDGVGFNSIHNSMIKAMSPLYAHNILNIWHMQLTVRAADKKSSLSIIL